MSKKKTISKKIKKGACYSKAFKDIRKAVLNSEKQNFRARKGEKTVTPSNSTADVIENYAAAADEQQYSYNALAVGFDEALSRMENLVLIVEDLDAEVTKETAKRKGSDNEIRYEISNIKDELSEVNRVIANIGYLFEENLDIDIYGTRRKIKKTVKKIKKNDRIIGTYEPPAIVDLNNHKDGGC